MYENVPAQSANENNDQEEQKVESKGELAVAPTGYIIKQDEKKGIGTIDADDLVWSRIKLGQATSNAVIEGSAKSGEWYDDSTEESFGPSFQFTLVSRWKSRTLFSEDRNEPPVCHSPNGIRSTDGFHCASECPHAARYWKKDVRVCTEMQNYLVIPEGKQFPAVVSLSKSSIKAAHAFNRLLLEAPGDVWCRQYEFHTVRQTDARGSYNVAKVRRTIVDGEHVATDKEIQQLAERYFYVAEARRDDLEVNVTTGESGEVPF